jgi:hypothetical protein
MTIPFLRFTAQHVDSNLSICRDFCSFRGGSNLFYAQKEVSLSCVSTENIWQATSQVLLHHRCLSYVTEPPGLLTPLIPVIFSLE